MKPLSKELRNKFEKTIENAREIAEEAARVAIEQLGVGEASPYSHLSEEDRALRRRLRAHGRNLGDVRDTKTETQRIDTDKSSHTITVRHPFTAAEGSAAACGSERP